MIKRDKLDAQEASWDSENEGMPKENNILDIQIKDNHIEKDIALSLKNAFTPYFEQAEKLQIIARKIKITSFDQKKEMKDAHDARQILKRIRIEVEAKRKSLKEDSLRYGKAIDGIANVIKYLIRKISLELK